MSKIADLSIRLTVETTAFAEAVRRCNVALWAMLYGNEYDKATVRVVTAIGWERIA